MHGCSSLLEVKILHMVQIRKRFLHLSCEPVNTEVTPKCPVARQVTDEGFLGSGASLPERKAGFRASPSCVMVPEGHNPCGRYYHPVYCHHLLERYDFHPLRPRRVCGIPSAGSPRNMFPGLGISRTGLCVVTLSPSISRRHPLFTVVVAGASH